MNFDFQKYSYPSKRTVSFAGQGMVATSSPLPAQIGLDILKSGGNAIDAAIATAAALTVIEPTSNGIGSDSFALIWYKGKLYGLDGSGISPMGLTAAMLKEVGHDEMPFLGWEPVMVPGSPSAWAMASERFGKLDFSQLMEPAAKYAQSGYPIATNIGKLWNNAKNKFMAAGGKEKFGDWFDTFAPNDICPNAGDIWKCEAMAKTLREIGATKAESFYRGGLASKIDEHSKKTGGYIRAEDLAGYHAQWVEPITTNYKGYDIYEIPPNSHGITALMALNILKNFDLGKNREDAFAYHKTIEAMKLAFIDGMEYIADPASMKTKVADMLSEAYAKSRSELIGDTALTPKPGTPFSGGTVYLCTADSEGNMVSWIQSNYAGFGSGIVVPNTGIALQNRGANFTLDETKDNCYAPSKKSYHTIIPAFMAKDGKPIGPFGVMGGFMQPQGHLQVVLNTVEFGMNPQETLDAPRFQWVGGKKVQLERSVQAHIALKLAEMGHEIEIINDTNLMGKGEIIWRLDSGVLAGGAEPRCDGHVACY